MKADRYKRGEDLHVLSLSLCLEDYIPQDSPVRLIDKFVDKFVMERGIRYAGKGQSTTGCMPYEFNPLLKMYIYGYMNRLNGSRRLEGEAKRNLEMMYLMRNLRPSYHTISSFRKDNGPAVRECFRCFRDFLRAVRLQTGSVVAVDGTKVKANAEKSLRMLEDRMEAVDAKLDSYLSSSDEQDSYDELSERLEESESRTESLEETNRRLEDERLRLESEKKRLEERIASMKSAGSAFVHDPDARTMQFADGSKKAAYNVQAAVDKDSHTIVDTTVTTDPNNIHQLAPVVEKVAEETETVPEVVLADGGYNEDSNIEKVEGMGAECFIPEVGNAQRARDTENGIAFCHDKASDSYVCPCEKSLTFRCEKEKHGALYRVYRAKPGDCRDCRLRDMCTKSAHGRMIWVRKESQWRTEFNRKMTTARAKSNIGSRKGVIENVFGSIKVWMGKIPVLLTGKENVQTEVDLFATAYNMVRCVNLLGTECALSELDSVHF